MSEHSGNDEKFTVAETEVGAKANAKNTNTRVSFISVVEFCIIDCTMGDEVKTYVIVGDKVIIHTEREYYRKDLARISYVEKMLKEPLILGLKDLNVLKWRRNFVPNSFDYPIDTTVSWYLNIYFSDGQKPVKICGCNNYPRNFEGLLNLLNIEIIKEVKHL